MMVVRVAVIIMALALAGSTRAEAAWTPTENLAASGQRLISETQLAYDGSGRTYALWANSRYPASSDQVFLRERPSGGPWGAVQLVPVSDSIVRNLNLAVNVHGDVVVSWSGNAVSAMRRPAGGSWTAARAWNSPGTAGPTSGCPLEPYADVGDDGSVVVTWTSYQSCNGVVSRWRVMAVSYVPGSGWQEAPQVWGVSAVDVHSKPAVAVDETGHATVAFSARNASNQDQLWTVEGTVGTWSDPFLRGTTSRSTYAPVVASRDGVTAVAWYSDFGTFVAVDDAGSWSAAEQLPGGTSNNVVASPSAAVGAGGTVYVAWAALVGGGTVANVVTRSPSIGSSNTVISSAGVDAQSPSLAANAAGDVAAGWEEYTGGSWHAVSALRAAGDPWPTTPNLVTSATSSNNTLPRAAIDPFGHAAVAAQPISAGYGVELDVAIETRDAATAPGSPVTVSPSTASIGDVLTCGSATFGGTPPFRYAYAWLRDGAPIELATDDTYTVVAADGGHDIRCRLTATNDAGAADSTSDAVPIAPDASPDLSQFVTRSGTHLLLDGSPYRPVGMNIYNANSNDWCWYSMRGSILGDSLTAIGSGKNAMRAWFFQPLATTGGARDWSAFDHTLATARAHGYKIVATLTDQWGDCGVSTQPGYGFKDSNWYATGYKLATPAEPASYRDWVQEVVSRYKNDSSILAWQLVNEPEVRDSESAGCAESTAAGHLSSFATDVAGLIKSIDPYHLVSLGTIGGGQCGTQDTDYQAVMDTPSLDLCEYHDYTPSQFVPGDQFNGLARRIQQCDTLGKPLLVGELGVRPDQVGGSLADRARVVASKLCAQLGAGVAGMLLWAWDKDSSLLDNFDIGPGDPVLDALAPWSDPQHSCEAPAAPARPVAAAGDGRAAIAWSLPGSDGGSPLTGYTIVANPGGIPKTVGPSATSTTVTGLTNGTAYTFTVTATNAAGTSPPSTPSSAVTPTAGAPEPAAAQGTASATTSTTVSTGTDPSATGGASTAVTVPAGTVGGAVSVAQSATSTPAPVGYVLGGVQIDISAPAATVANPLVLVFTLTPAPGQTPAATEIYRTEGSSAATLVGDCGGPAGQAVPDPCVATRATVTIAGAEYVRLTVRTSTASRWNSATPRPAAVTVSDKGYTPQSSTVQPGAAVKWTFAGKKSHTVTDASALGAAAAPWFNSGAKTSGTYAFTFPASGTFAYRSTASGDSFGGTVVVPLVVTPTAGSVSSTFSVMWTTQPLSGYVSDVQYRFRSAGSKMWRSWAAFRNGATSTSATFKPDQGAGTYAFRARLRNASTGKTSDYSPDVAIPAS